MNKEALHKISYGLYIVSSKKDNKLNGQIANTVFQVCSDPVVIAVCINKQNLTYEFIRESKVYSVSILSEETPMQFIGRFGFKSGRDIEKFNGIKYKLNRTGVPIVLKNSVAYIEAEVINSSDVETHTVFFGKVIEAQVLSAVQPMTYEYYHKIKHEKVPKSAPTYISEM